MDDEPKKRPAHEVGMALDTLSIAELHERIALLRSEIERMEKAIQIKDKSRSDADAVFKF